MGLFGKSDKEKEQEEKARHEEARRKMQESLRRREQKAQPQAKPPAQARPPQAGGQPKPPGAPAPRPAAPAGGGVTPAGMTPTAAKPAAAALTYTVQKGDSLSKIAKKHLGDANKWQRIYEVNKSLIGEDPDKIFPGQVLTIPSAASPSTPGGGRTA